MRNSCVYRVFILWVVFSLAPPTHSADALFRADFEQKPQEQAADTQETLLQDDHVIAGFGTATRIAILSNDILPTDTAGAITIRSPPRHGSLTVHDDGTVSYQAGQGYFGSDQFQYQIDNHRQAASVTIDIRCHRCISLFWDAGSADTLGYKVYFGFSPKSTDRLLADINIANDLIDPEQPSFTFRTGPETHSVLCFRVSAYNTYTESELSTAMCWQNS